MERVDWNSLRSASGSSGFVPGAVRELLAARTAPEAEVAYWKLDNSVVVQGQLFESARWVVGPLLVALSQPRAAFVRERIANLLVEIAFGEPHERELASKGDPDLAARCIDELRKALPTFYGMLDDSTPMLRLGGLDLLDAAEADRDRMAAAASGLLHDPDAKVARRAAELAS
ncbi:hypothetical protein [Luteimicrobium subarcticum]|uniref:hypothetical protein n=1 Tax=Luteimicrobium subarcticum TaxID=620910 RepID=UPI0012FE2746|nr:hypothetical protein [Luteimicrobium subarcticum]